MIPERIRNRIRANRRLFAVYTPVNRVAASVIPPFIRTLKIIRKKFWNVRDREVDARKVMINIGGGYYFRRHWKVLDFPSPHYNYWLDAIDYAFDLTNGQPFPFQGNSVACFYSSHTFEHLPQECCQHIFDEIFRCLHPGGGVRIMVPDFDLGYEAFKQHNIAFFQKYPGKNIEQKFLNFFATYWQKTVSSEELREQFQRLSKAQFADFYTLKIPRESQAQFPGNHINWWNYDKLAAMLGQAGFRDVYRSAPQESRFPEMRGPGRWSGFDSTHPELSLIAEAVKSDSGHEKERRAQ